MGEIPVRRKPKDIVTGKPKAYGEQDLHLLYRYSYRHSHLLPLQRSLRYAFNADNNALLPLFLRTVREFGAILSHDIFRAGRLDQ